LLNFCSNSIAISISISYVGGIDPRKDTLRNISDTGEFVVNIVDEDLAQAMNATSAGYPPDVDEFEFSFLLRFLERIHFFGSHQFENVRLPAEEAQALRILVRHRRENNFVDVRKPLALLIDDRNWKANASDKSCD